VNAHGTGTRRTTRSRSRRCARLRRALARIPVSSSKSQLGHCLGAAGALEAVVTVLALDEGICRRRVSCATPDPAWADLDLVPRPAGARRSASRVSSSYGFGGHNVTLVARDGRSVRRSRHGHRGRERIRHGVAPFWAGLVDGASSLAPIRRFEVPPHASLGAEVPPLDTRALVTRRSDGGSTGCRCMALAAGRLALADAGLSAALTPERTALALGSPSAT
jgi:3-oxoacyl-[acyl-carrier-protein] synthase II